LLCFYRRRKFTCHDRRFQASWIKADEGMTRANAELNFNSIFEIH
jgi:hypothetical protein